MTAIVHPPQEEQTVPEDTAPSRVARPVAAVAIVTILLVTMIALSMALQHQGFQDRLNYLKNLSGAAPWLGMTSTDNNNNNGQ